MSDVRDEKLKICHVITRMIVGGAQENTFLSVRGQIELGHDVRLVSGPTCGPEGNLLREWSDTPVPVTEIPTLCREAAPWRDLRTLWALFRFFRRERFDVVHTHSAKAGVLGRIAAKLAGIPVVVHTVHGQPWSVQDAPLKKKFYVLSERIAARCAVRLYTVARAMIDQCVELKIAPRGKYHVVYSGMDLARFAAASGNSALPREPGIPPEHRVIVTLARLSPLKGYEFIPRAFARIAAEYADVSLLILGDGKTRGRTDRELERRGIRDRVVLGGLVTPNEVPRFLAQGTLLWHLSLREGLPRAVVQALAVGMPAVGFRLDGTPEVILDNRTGYCVEPGNVDAVVAATEKLLDDPAGCKKMGQNGRELVSDRFDWKKMAEFLAEDYRILLRQRSGR
ncbi:MAG: glycosyltransferase family 4 protein [Victivallaceae bacterium]|nr:glycosyltransferase family 4 protein [Victivallaceae bacterium]